MASDMEGVKEIATLKISSWIHANGFREDLWAVQSLTANVWDNYVDGEFGKLILQRSSKLRVDERLFHEENPGKNFHFSSIKQFSASNKKKCYPCCSPEKVSGVKEVYIKSLTETLLQEPLDNRL
ncbi:CLUMA_CG003763, isoform A [Clunio marinus]|uniref:CLUMA_CG003763, isoform A n=1 Tax=Clunio marinus TaxID=568069 RepID=A0A1J1HU67_9DIPT|nr:CLUMA_CG003763, isoform A [Clunio marinus]